MPFIRVVTKEGETHDARSFDLVGNLVKIRLRDGGELELADETIDFARSFEANQGIDFDPPPAAPPKGEPCLELVSRREERTGDFLVIEGLVRNLTPVELANVAVTATGNDGEGKFVTAEEAVLDWNPVPPSGESPFRVILKGAGQIEESTLRFRVLLGDELATAGLVPDPD